VYKEIVKWPAASLKKKSADVIIGTELCNTVVADLKDTFRVKDGYGLAAPQIGYSSRVIVVNPSLIGMPEDHQFQDYLVMINPIISCYGEKARSNEACFSVPGISDVVERYSQCDVSFTSEDGNSETIEGLTGLASFCIQHEVDHLEGKLFLDRMKNLKRSILLKKLRKAAKKKEQARLLAQKEWEEDVMSYSGDSPQIKRGHKPRTDKDRKRKRQAKLSKRRNRKSK